jgi:outer membrane protein TolC
MKYLVTFQFLLVHFLCVGQTRDLDYFIRQGKQNSPVLKDFQQQVLSAKIDSQLLQAAQRPQVNFLSTNSYAPIIAGYGYDEAISNIANISGIIQVNRNFITRNNLGLQYRAIALQKSALLDSMRLSELDMVKTITDQYINAYNDLLTLQFNKEVFDLLTQEEQVLKKLTQASVYKQTDYLSFYITMQQQELTYLQSQIQYNTDYLTLNYLTGIEDTTIATITEPYIPDSVSADIYHSVFYNRFTIDSLRLANEKNQIDFTYKPKIGAYADAGYTSSLQHTPYKNFGFSAGISITVPLYDGNQKRLKYAQINTRETTRMNNKDFFFNQYRQQLAQLRQQLSSIDLLVNKIKQQIAYTYTLITANNKLLETGDIIMKDYVLAITNYLTAKNLLTENTISRLRILNQLNYWQR